MKRQAKNYPLNIVVFGSQPLCFSGDYYVEYKSPAEVKDIAAALKAIDKPWLEKRYWEMSKDYDGEKCDDDLEYTWQNFDGLRTFYEKASRANRSVIFTVDQ